MLNFLYIILGLAYAYFLFNMLKELKKIAQDTRKKEELMALLDRFGDLFIAAKKKIPRPPKKDETE